MPLLLARQPNPDPTFLAQLTRLGFQDLAREQDKRGAIIQQATDNYFKSLSAQQQQAQGFRQAQDQRFDQAMQTERLGLQKAQVAQDSAIDAARLGLDVAETQSRIGLNEARATEIATDQARVGDITAESLSGFLGSGLKPFAKDFIEAGAETGIDPRFLAAIAKLETANGTSSAFRNKNNAMGISNSRGPVKLNSVRDSIFQQARTMARDGGPYSGRNTISEIGGIYAPPGAGNDPRGTNGYWPTGVSKFFREMGGDPRQSIRGFSIGSETPLANQPQTDSAGLALPEVDTRPVVRANAASRRTSSDFLEGALGGSLEDTEAYIDRVSRLLESGRIKNISSIETQILDALRSRGVADTPARDRANGFLNDIEATVSKIRDQRRDGRPAQGNVTEGVKVGSKLYSIEEAAKHYVPATEANPNPFRTALQKAFTEAIESDVDAIRAVDIIRGATAFLGNQGSESPKELTPKERILQSLK